MQDRCAWVAGWHMLHSKPGLSMTRCSLMCCLGKSLMPSGGRTVFMPAVCSKILRYKVLGLPAFIAVDAHVV